MQRISLNGFIRAYPKCFRFLSASAVVIAIAVFLPGKSVGEEPFADALGSLVEKYDDLNMRRASTSKISMDSVTAFS